MDRSVPVGLIVFFLVTTLIALVMLGLATRAKAVWVGSVVWLAVQSAVSLTGFYTETAGLPPRLLLALGPPFLLAVVLALIPAGKRLIDGMDLKWTVLLHSVRVLVEICLYWLFLCRQVPALMTFEDGNVDVLAGLTAPVVWWAYSAGKIGRKTLVGWNAVCLLSLGNIVVRALLAAPFPFEKLGFEQPNVAILQFPFVLLPAFIVPAVFFCHLAIFRKVRHPGGGLERQ